MAETLVEIGDTTYRVTHPAAADALIDEKEFARDERLPYWADIWPSAVALARTTPPDLIVLDVGMPRLDGFEVVDILRQGKGRGTPLIVFTGQELSSMDQTQLTLGITRHLTKARASEDELLSSVKELLNGLLAPRKELP